jgi:hypothetical protein
LGSASVLLLIIMRVGTLSLPFENAPRPIYSIRQEPAELWAAYPHVSGSRISR